MNETPPTNVELQQNGNFVDLVPTIVNVGASVVGTDNVAPIIPDPQERWRIWHKNQIYLGGPGSGKYVPKVGDYVTDNTTTTVSWFLVYSVNETTLVPVLKNLKNVDDAGTFSEEDKIIGVGPGTQADTFRVYLDTSVRPYRLDVDHRFTIAGTDAKYCKIFRGADLTESGNVISRIYDAQGNVVNENINLELIATTAFNNVSVKIVPTCYTTESMPDNEVVTAVIYSDQGFVVRKRQLLVENTRFIRNIASDKRYVVNISLESPFLLPGDEVIRYPLNVPLQGLNLYGVVTYSDGEIRLPVDNQKFSIYGFEQYQATQVGQKFDVALNYRLSPGEVFYGTTLSSDHTGVTRHYDATTMNVDSSYTYKLYCSPKWVDAVIGYELEWWLYNLDKSIHYDATSFVRVNPSFSPFRPNLFSVQQQLNVSLNVSEIDASLPNYIHSQNTEIVLYKRGDEFLNPWAIGYVPGQQDPYGIDTYCMYSPVTSSTTSLTIKGAATTFDKWIKLTYVRSRPLTDITVEPAPPEPTHFAIYYKTTRVEYVISDWDKILTITQAITQYSNIRVEFLLKDANTTKYLSMVTMPCYLNT
jgi:hypothetical protein